MDLDNDTTEIPSSSSLSPSSTSLNHLNYQSSSTDSNSTNNPQTFQLSSILLVATLNGQLHALDRKTGAWNWTLNDPNHVSSSLIDHPGLIDSPRLSSDQYQSHDNHELYAIEPTNDGDLYVFIKSSTQPSQLEKLPLSVSQLVNLSPFTFPGDSSKMFIGKKETHMIAIDLKTGLVVNSLHSQPKRGPLKAKANSRNNTHCNPKHSFFSSRQTELNNHTCPVDPTTSEPVGIKNDHHHQSIHQRPRDLLYIGRTDYHVSIYSKPNQLIQTLRYSTYAPSNLPHGMQIMWTRTPDELYLEPTHDGNLVCFQATPSTPGTPTNRSERPKIKWENSFDHPVTSVFDILFPDAPQSSPTSDSADQNSPDPGSSKITNQSTPNTSKSTTSQQPIIFVQPKFLPLKSDNSHSRFSVDDQFDLFKHLHSQTTFSTPSQTTPPIGQKRAFVGKYQDSFYVMSQQNYPLVTFAPPAFQTLGDELSIGTHILLNSQALNGFIDFSYTNRLLNPGSSHNALIPAHSRFALDPAPSPLTLPTSEPNSIPSPNSALSSSLTLRTSNPEKLPAEKAFVPIELHQRPAQISSLLVKAFKQQLMLSSPPSSQTNNQRADDRFPDLNPLVTFLLVLGVISWWASKKIESPSTARWEHLHRLVNQALGNDSKPEQSSNLKNVTGAKDSPCRPTTTETATTVPIDEFECCSNPDAVDKTMPEGSHDPESLLLNSKQKPKRRRGKRPGQKAAAAAKAQAGLANSQDLVQLPPSLPDSIGVPLSNFKPTSSAEVKTTQKSKTNSKKSKSTLIKTIVGATECFDKVILPPMPNNAAIMNDNIFKSVNTPFSLNDQNLHVDQPINAELEPCVDNYVGLESQRVGSLIVSKETIGYGSHGTVVLRGTFQGRQVAVKRLLKDFVTLASHEVSLLQESDDHPNVVRYFVKESLNNFLYIALELCNASLHDFIERRHFEEFEELERIFDPKKALKQITSGLRYLHKLKIVHRDVKPQNILISLTKPLPRSSKGGGGGSEGKRFRMLISDFGLCKKLELDESSFAQTANHAAGSFGYRAPEILKGQVDLSEQRDSMASSSLTNCTIQNGVNNDSNESSSASNSEPTRHHRLTRSIDIFSLGCIYYYVLTKGDHPFGTRYEREMNILKDEVWLDQLDGLDEETFEAQQLIRSMIKSDPKERPSAEEVLQNPYFWEPSKRLNFLCDCSDRFEAMDRTPPDQTLLKLENHHLFFKYLLPNRGSGSIISNSSSNHQFNHSIKTFDWCKMMDKGLVDNLGKYRKYDGGSIRDLLRVMRNKKHHFQDLPEGIKKSLGELPDGFLSYFSKKFPSLLVHVYDIVVHQSNLKFEKIFRNYFDIVDDI